tara:strand:- start:364 stop:636 length:273 start_codon:yes stop_codon:yes gene_type:complete
MHTRKLIQQRPNTGVEFYVPEANIINIINDNGGNFQQVTSDDGLTLTISMTFSDEVYSAMLVNETLLNDMTKRQKYCEDNSISFNVLDPA